MGLRDRVRTIFNSLTRAQAVSPTVRWSDLSQTLGARQYPDKARLLELYTGWAAIVADRNATAVASVPLRVYRKAKAKRDSGARALNSKQVKALVKRSGEYVRKAINEDDELEEVLTDNPLLDLIQNPNPLMSMADLIGYAEISRAFNGNGYLSLVKPSPNASLVTEIWPWDPSLCDIVVDEGELIGHYMYGQPEKKKRFGREVVVHIRRVTPLSPYYGTSDFQAVMAHCMLSQEYTKFAIEFIRQGCAPSAILHIEGANQKQMDEMTEKYRNQSSGSARAGRLLGVGGAGKPTLQVLTAQHESSYLQSDQAAMEIIANAGAMPVSLLKLDTAALATAHEAKPTWQMFGLRPRCQRIEDALNRTLVPIYGDDNMFLAFDDAVDNQQSDAADTVTVSVWTNKLITKNEARAKLGYDALPGPEGDEFYQDPAPSLGFGGGGFGDNPEQDPEDPEDSPEGPEMPDDDEVDTPKPEKIVRLSEMQKHPHGQKDLRPEQVELAKQLARVFRETGGDLARIYAANPTIPPRDALELIRYGQRVTEVLAPEMERTFIAFYDRAVEQVRSDGSGLFNMADSGAVQHLATYRVRLSRSLTDTQEFNLRTALAETAVDGGTLRDASTRVQEVMENATGYEAERIAITEGQRAAMMGRETGWQSLQGDVVGKKWVLSGNPCPLCVKMADTYGKSVPLGKPMIPQGGSIVAGGTRYVMDYSDVYGPPVHPGCVCNLEPVFADEKRLAA